MTAPRWTRFWTALPAAAAVYYVFLLRPWNIWENTPPRGGDVGAHWALMGRLSETFTWDFLGGMPLWVNYFPLPFTVAVAFGKWVGEGLGLRTVMIAGGPALIFACWALLRSGGLSRKAAALGAGVGGAVLALASYPRPNWFGVSATSAVIGQFSYQWAFVLSLIAVAAFCARSGQRRRRADVGWAGAGGLAAAAACLCHIYALPLLAALGAAAWVVPRARPRLWGLPLGIVAAGWLLVPLADSLRWSSSGGHQQLGWTGPFPLWMTAMIPLLPLGIARIWKLKDFRWVLAAPLLLGAPLYAAGTFTGGGPQLWNGRLLPFIWAPLCVAAGIGLGEWATAVARSWKRLEPAAASLAVVGAGALILIAHGSSGGHGELAHNIWGKGETECSFECAAAAAATQAGGGNIIFPNDGIFGPNSAMHQTPPASPETGSTPGGRPSPGPIRLTEGIWEQTGLRARFAYPAASDLIAISGWAERNNPAHRERPYQAVAATIPGEPDLEAAGRKIGWLGGNMVGLNRLPASLVENRWDNRIWGFYAGQKTKGGRPMAAVTKNGEEWEGYALLSPADGEETFFWLSAPPPPRGGIFLAVEEQPPLRRLLGSAGGWREAAYRWWNEGAEPHKMPVRGKKGETPVGEFVWAETEITAGKEPVIRTASLPAGPAYIHWSWYPGWEVVSGGKGPWAAGPAGMAVIAYGGEMELRWNRGWKWTVWTSAAATAALAVSTIWGLSPPWRRLKSPSAVGTPSGTAPPV